MLTLYTARQRQTHRADISDSEDSGSEDRVDELALMPVAENVDAALQEVNEICWGRTLTVESSDEEEEEEVEVVEEEGQEEKDEHLTEWAREMQKEDDHILEGHSFEQHHADEEQQVHNQDGKLLGGKVYGTDQAAGIDSTGHAAHEAALPLQPLQLADDNIGASSIHSSTTKLSRAPLRRASHFYVDRRLLADIDGSAPDAHVKVHENTDRQA